MRVRNLVVALTMVLVAAASASATPFTNGSFESSSCVPPEGYFTELSIGETCITGWTVVQSTVDYIHDYWAASDPDKSVDLNGNENAGGIQQTFDTLFGHTYQVLFDLAGNPDGPPDVKTLNVGTNWTAASPYSFDDSAQDKENMGWATREFLFLAGGSATTLQFLSTTDSALYGPALDNVRLTDVTGVNDLTPAAVPEPASLILLGTGFLGLARRKLRK